MILFRKEAEKILKDYGFSEDFTVSRIGKYIWLVGKCGKEIMQISDLEVGSKLSKTERELLIEDYLYPNIIMKKAKLDKLIDLEKKIKHIKEQLEIIKEKENVYIDISYNYTIDETHKTLYVNIKDTSYRAQIKEDIETHEQFVNMTDVKIDNVHNIYDKLMTLMPIRDRVIKLDKELSKLENNNLILKRELKIVC